MAITVDRIKDLAAGVGVRKIAVVNFLGSIGDMPRGAAMANLTADAKSYRWNKETVTAIRTGIDEYFR